MIFHGGALECRVRQKVNNNQLLKDENLAFIGCSVDAAMVEVDAADRSRRDGLLS
jgi:hypothetical protein